MKPKSLLYTETLPILLSVALPQQKSDSTNSTKEQNKIWALEVQHPSCKDMQENCHTHYNPGPLHIPDGSSIVNKAKTCTTDSTVKHCIQATSQDTECLINNKHSPSLTHTTFKQRTSFSENSQRVFPAQTPSACLSLYFCYMMCSSLRALACLL